MVRTGVTASKLQQPDTASPGGDQRRVGVRGDFFPSRFSPSVPSAPVLGRSWCLRRTTVGPWPTHSTRAPPPRGKVEAPQPPSHGRVEGRQRVLRLRGACCNSGACGAPPAPTRGIQSGQPKPGTPQRREPSPPATPVGATGRVRGNLTCSGMPSDTSRWDGGPASASVLELVVHLPALLTCP